MLDRRGFLGAAAVGATSLLAACSTGSSSSKSTTITQGGSGGAGFPVTIKHAFGSTTIKSAPKRVVTAGWSDVDTAAALGVVPVAAPAIVWGGNAAKSTDWFDAKVKELGGKAPERYSDTAGIPADKIASYQPDLILATNSGLSKAQYDQLSKIAPVVAYPNLQYGTPWETSTTMIAQALGKVSEGQKLIDDTKKQISDAVAKYPALKGKTASWLYFTPTSLNQVGIYTPIDARPHMLSEFGTPDGPSVAALTKASKSFFVELSSEKATQIDSDVVIFDQTTSGDTDKIKGDALLGKIPALKDGAYVALDDKVASAAMSTPTVLSIPVALEKFLPKLADAAKKAK